jgi:hypothetical protein
MVAADRRWKKEFVSHEAMLTWAGGASDADQLDPATLRFDNLAEDLRKARE